MISTIHWAIRFLPSFFFCPPHSREPSFLAASSSPSFLHLASLPPFTLYMYLCTRVPSRLARSSLSLPRSVVHQSFFFPFFLLPPPARFPTSACMLQSLHSLRFSVSYTHNSLLLCIGISMFVFSAHMLKINSRILQRWTVAATARFLSRDSTTAPNPKLVLFHLP